MNYIARKKERKLKQKLLKIFNIFKLKSLNLDFASIIILIGIGILIISILSPWLYKNNQNLSWTSFSNIGGNIGYIMIIYIISLFFIIFSNNAGEKLKLASNIHLKNYTYIIFGSIFIISTSIIYISFIKGLNIFFEDIEVGKGIIFYILGGIVILIGGLIKRNMYYKGEYETFICETKNEEKIKNDKSNMKLPF